MSIIVALLIFTVIIFFHELGHFAFARKNGIAVEEFAIGMGPKIWGFHKNGTDWSIRILPIGGYCKIYGEDGEEEIDENEKLYRFANEDIINEKEIRKDNKKARIIKGDAFFEKTVLERISVIFGGPLFNFIMAFVFSIILMILSINIASNNIAFFAEDSPAKEAGIMAQDELISINGHRVLRPIEANVYINAGGGKPLEVKVKRIQNGESKIMKFDITPSIVEQNPNIPPEESTDIYRIGVGFGTAKKTLFNIVKYSIYDTASYIKITYYSLAMLITGQVSANQLSGPVGIVNAIGDTYNNSIIYGLRALIGSISMWIVLISANLGVMNLLPLPALDGGRLVFLVIEGIRGKPIAPNKEGIVHLVGFALLMLLMVFVLYNDIVKLMM